MDTENNKSSSSQESEDRKTVILRPRRVDYPRKDREHQEEYAAEVNPIPIQSNKTSTSTTSNGTSTDTSTTNETDSSGMTEQDSQLMGYIGLAFGIGSLFFWSIILGPLAAVIGYYAYINEQKTLGAWALGLGILATLSYFVMIPFVS